MISLNSAQNIDFHNCIFQNFSEILFQISSSGSGSVRFFRSKFESMTCSRGILQINAIALFSNCSFGFLASLRINSFNLIRASSQVSFVEGCRFWSCYGSTFILMSYGSVLNGSNITFKSNNVDRFLQTESRVSTSFQDISLENNFQQMSAALYFGASNQIQILNLSSQNLSSQSNGSVMFVGSNSSISIVDSVFHSNYAEYNGGVIFIDTQSRLILERVEFQNNSGAFGGAIFASMFSSWSAVNCTFLNNFARIGGAIYFQELTSAISQKCTFIGNQAFSEITACSTIEGSGGAIFWESLRLSHLNLNSFSFFNKGRVRQKNIFKIFYLLNFDWSNIF
jgi:predicted outer membrane repeat protein